MYLQIKKAELLPDARGNHIKITMVGLYDSKGKRQKRVKLNEFTLQELVNTKMDISIEPTETTST